MSSHNSRDPEEHAPSAFCPKFKVLNRQVTLYMYNVPVGLNVKIVLFIGRLNAPGASAPYDIRGIRTNS
jgi:hypothetical protein